MIFNNIVIWILMTSLAIGAISATIKPESGLGKEFLNGIYSIDHIFLPVAGVMTLLPVLSSWFQDYFHFFR